MGVFVILAVLLAAACLAATRPRAALLTTVFLSSWNGLIADMGISIYAYQISLLALAGVTLVRSLQPGWTPVRIAAGGWLTVLILWAIILSVIMMGFLPEADKLGGALRNSTTRAAIQIALFIFTVCPVGLIAWLGMRGDDLAACARVYVASGIVLATIGWGQLVVWYATGSNPLQVAAISSALGGNETYSRQGAFDFGQLAIYRMNSLAGEPRNLGVALVLGMLIIQAHALTAVKPPTLRLLVIWLYLLAAAVATYSTSAAVLWLIGTAVQLPAAWLFGVRVRRSLGSMAAAGLLVMAGLGGAVVAIEARGIPVIDLLAERTIERIDTNGAVEDFDLAIIDYLTEHPRAAVTGVGLGAAHLYAAPYLDPLFALYAESSVFAAKTAYLRFISEIGAIGLVLFLAWYTRLTMLAARAGRGDDRLSALVPMTATLLVVYLANGQISNEFWIGAGLLTASCASAHRITRTIPASRATQTVTV